MYILIVTALITTVSACSAPGLSGEENSQAENPSNATNTDTDENFQLSTGSSNLGVGSTQTNPVDGAMAVYIPAGEFMIGSEATANALQVLTVYLDAFWIYQTEVTNAQFSEFVATTGYQTFVEERGRSYIFNSSGPHQVTGADWGHPAGPDSSISEILNHPVVHIHWNDAAAYCEWAGGSLPTEAQWESAARGGLAGQAYPWGDEAPTCSNGTANGAQFNLCDGQTLEVGSFQPNGYGLYDMAGNAVEWVNDWYDGNYSEGMPYENPTGPASGTYHVLRGGSFYASENYLQVYFRTRLHELDSIDWSNGFRCVWEP